MRRANNAENVDTISHSIGFSWNQKFLAAGNSAPHRKCQTNIEKLWCDKGITPKRRNHSDG